MIAAGPDRSAIGVPGCDRTPGYSGPWARAARPLLRPPRSRQRLLLPRELRAGRDRRRADHSGAGDERGLGDRARRAPVRADRAALRTARSGVRGGVEASDATAAGAGPPRLAPRGPLHG